MLPLIPPLLVLANNFPHDATPRFTDPHLSWAAGGYVIKGILSRVADCRAEAVKDGQRLAHTGDFP